MSYTFNKNIPVYMHIVYCSNMCSLILQLAPYGWPTENLVLLHPTGHLLLLLQGRKLFCSAGGPRINPWCYDTCEDSKATEVRVYYILKISGSLFPLSNKSGWHQKGRKWIPASEIGDGCDFAWRSICRSWILKICQLSSVTFALLFWESRLFSSP